MVIRQLKPEQYDAFCNMLLQTAESTPLDASCTVRMYINSTEFAVKLQPEPHRRIAILQAYEVTRDADGSNFRLITSNGLLSSLLELLLDQYFKYKPACLAAV